MILMYHDVAEPADRDRCGFPGKVAARYKLSPTQFGSHLDAIAATGVDVALISHDQPRPAAAVTFDDGGASALLAAEMLEARGWRGHFFVTTSRIGTPGFLDAGQIEDLARRGHAVGSHSHTHPTYMGKLGVEELDVEWRTSREILATILGSPPALASIPGGFFKPPVAARAREAGYRILLTSEPRSRPSSRHGILVLGRYTMWSTTRPDVAGAYVEGALLPRARLWLEWNGKKAVKTIAPAAYEAARRAGSARRR
jgi:peptidoglycan/xylan/chitin deacetylase (PgdA/CDA1 family)